MDFQKKAATIRKHFLRHFSESDDIYSMEISKFKCFRIFRNKVWIQPLRKNWKTILVKLTSESIRVVFQLFESLVCFTSGRWNRFSCCCWSWCGCRHHGSAFWQIKTYTFHWFSYDFGSIVICYCVIGFNVFGQSWKSTINNLFFSGNKLLLTTKLVCCNKFLVVSTSWFTTLSSILWRVRPHKVFWSWFGSVRPENRNVRYSISIFGKSLWRVL